MALYRTYRPARLDEVVGQEHVVGPLTRALEHDRMHHAYLLSGPRGCGKTSTARILARSLNCEQGPTPDPCGVCQSCTDLAANGPGSIDVIELDAASHGGVDDTRELRERAMFAPASSRYKIYIIDEAHMVTPQGFNALLKLVEEPPEHVRFIFATTEAEKVLPTIRSRTHNYTFRLVPLKVLQQHLAHICEQEGIPAEPEALTLIARAGAGSVRDSLSVLGQVISGCGPEGITYADAVGQLGMTDTALLNDTIAALAQHDGATLFNVIESVMDAGHEPRRFVTDLLERMRDLIILQVVPTAAEAGLVEGPADAVAVMAEQAQQFGHAELTRYAEVVSATLSALKGATAPRLQLELMVAQLMLPALDGDAGALAARIDQLERRMHAVPPAAAPHEPAAEAPATPPPASKKASAVPPPPPKLSAVAPSSEAVSPPEAKRGKPAAQEVSAAEMDITQIRSLWPAVLEVVKTQGKVAWMVFSDSAPLSYSDGTLAVAMRDASKAANARSSGHIERLQAAVTDVLRIDATIDLILAPDTPSAAVDPATSIEADEPSADDVTVNDVSGVDLAIRELGATTIGEIEHS
jgi:DNA polymerase III subunit gamma/tau